MKRDFIRRAFLALALLPLFCGASVVPGARAGALHIALLDATEVHGDAILLADLLPKDVPRVLREAAEKISLGVSPQNGTARRLSRLTVLAAMMANGLEASEFQVPETITVQRASRAVTRDEVFAAIRQALAKANDSPLPDFQPKDLSFSAVEFPDQASELAVTDISFDEFIGRTRFRLSSVSDPAVHPFYVTAQLSNWPLAGSSVSASPGGVGSVAASASSPVLVRPGHPARLRLHSSNSKILLEVQPLQPGRLGEVIRVRLPGNGKTFRARVLEGGALDADF